MVEEVNIEVTKPTVAVTSGSTYTGSWLIKYLLESGYTVKAFVRDLDESSFLCAIDGANERLTLINQNLMEFDALIDGCEGVFHTDVPIDIPTDNPEQYVIEYAKQRTLNLLTSVTKHPSVKKVIMTSSAAAIRHFHKPITQVIDESMFSDEEYCKENKLWYPLWHTMAEAAAFSFAEANGINLITINPDMVIGPLLQNTLDPGSLEVLTLLKGATKTYKNLCAGFVNIQDVARAHISAFEKDIAKGRYLMVERVVHFCEVAQLLGSLYPYLKIPKRCVSKPLAEIYTVSQKKITNLLDENLTPLRVSLEMAVESLDEMGFHPTSLIQQFDFVNRNHRKVSNIIEATTPFFGEMQAAFRHLLSGKTEISLASAKLMSELRGNGIVMDLEDEDDDEEDVKDAAAAIAKILEGMIIRADQKGHATNQNIARLYVEEFPEHEDKEEAIVRRVKQLREKILRKGKKGESSIR